MADLNTGSNQILSESTRTQERKDDAAHSIPGAFPGEEDVLATSNKIPGGFPDQQPEPLAPVVHKPIAASAVPPTNPIPTASAVPITNAATSLGHGPSGHPIVAGVNDRDLARGPNQPNFTGDPMNLTDSTTLKTNPAHAPELAGTGIASHPVPPRQSEVGSNVVGHSSGLPPRIPRQADGNIAPGTQGVGEIAVPIERSPVKHDEKATADTVKPGEIAQEVAQGTATAAVAGGIAAKDAAVWTKDRAVENYPAARDTVVDNAVWTKDKAVENYPAARDTVVDNAVWAKDAAVENYPAVRDQTVSAATTAGNAAYAGAASAAAAIASAAQAAYNATAEAMPESLSNPLGANTTTTSTGTPASSVPETVKDSLAKSGESPEAAANPEAVGDKRALESELLAIAGSDADKHTGSSAAAPSLATHDQATPLVSRGPLAGHMPNRTESTDFVKILGTETYNKPHGADNTGLGAAAQGVSPAHGGGPAAPKDSGSLTGGIAGAGIAGAAGGAVLGQSGVNKGGPNTSYTYDQNELKDPRIDTHQTNTSALGAQSSGAMGGQPKSLHGNTAGEHVAPPTGTAAQAPGHGPSVSQPPSYSQAQTQGQGPAKTTAGQDIVQEVDYNTLSSGTPSGVASTHYQNQ